MFIWKGLSPIPYHKKAVVCPEVKAVSHGRFGRNRFMGKALGDIQNITRCQLFINYLFRKVVLTTINRRWPAIPYTPAAAAHPLNHKHVRRFSPRPIPPPGSEKDTLSSSLTQSGKIRNRDINSSTGLCQWFIASTFSDQLLWPKDAYRLKGLYTNWHLPWRLWMSWLSSVFSTGEFNVRTEDFKWLKKSQIEIKLNFLA